MGRCITRQMISAEYDENRIARATRPVIGAASDGKRETQVTHIRMAAIPDRNRIAEVARDWRVYRRVPTDHASRGGAD
jgi:hypothetical protein